MKHFWKTALLCVLVLSSFAACTQKQPSEEAASSQTERQEEASSPTVRGEFAKLGPEKGNWIGLTTQQKLEDIDYLYQTLQENYPYFHVMERMTGKSLEQEYQTCRKEVEACDSDAAFYVLLDRFLEQAEMVGHLHMVSPMAYPFLRDGYQNKEGISEEYWERMDKLAAAFGNPQSAESYEKMGEIFWPVFDQVQAYYAGEEEPAAEQAEEEEFVNVETKILEPGRIAYINIKTFDMEYYSQSKEILLDFYEQVGDYDHVIFDISQNSGGGSSYFDNLMAAPNIEEPLVFHTYMLIKDGERNREFVNDWEAYQPVSQLPQLPRMNQEDLADLDLFREEISVVEPLTGQKALKGKLWLLVSGAVFSSSEYAASFAKETGFAALVGTQTGGDGIGEDPLPVILPNSGLMARYSPIYGVTFDGAGSQEWGTTPDIVSPEGEDPLTTCLKAIEDLEEGNKKDILAGTSWIAENDRSYWVFGEDKTFYWYQTKGETDDNYFAGIYEFHIGQDALDYLTEDLSDYGVTEEEMLGVISRAPEYTLDNFVCFSTTNQSFMLNGQEQLSQEAVTSYFGFFLQDRTCLDIANMITGSYYSFTKEQA